jgi:hypothetical protein
VERRCRSLVDSVSSIRTTCCPRRAERALSGLGSKNTCGKVPGSRNGCRPELRCRVLRPCGGRRRLLKVSSSRWAPTLSRGVCISTTAVTAHHAQFASRRAHFWAGKHDLDQRHPGRVGWRCESLDGFSAWAKLCANICVGKPQFALESPNVTFIFMERENRKNLKDPNE